MKISEIITDKYKLRLPPTVYYDLLADVVEAEEEQEPKTDTWSIKDVADTLAKHGLIEEQEPCEDAVSRQAVIELCEINPQHFDFLSLIDDIKDLPSVNPQEPCEMTAEEYRQRMIQAFHNADCDELIAICVLPTEKEFEHLEWLLKSHYKKEPCEDAVSRQAVIDTIYHECSGENLDIDFAKVLLLQRKIKTLQSVNPQKLGHWKERRNRATGHIETVCSECGAEEGYPYNDYCGNCGAKMVEPQESEE